MGRKRERNGEGCCGGSVESGVGLGGLIYMRSYLKHGTYIYCIVYIHTYTRIDLKTHVLLIAKICFKC